MPVGMDIDIDIAEAPGRGAMGMAVSVPVDTLLDAETPRLSGMDRDHVRRLAGLEEPLPPIVVHRQTMRVVDGMHRLHAARLSGRATIEVTYFSGSTADAFLLAVESNVRHGLPLTLPERRHAAQRILRSHPQWSDRAIAVRTGLSGKTVGTLRRAGARDIPQDDRPTVRVGHDGRARSLSPAEGRLRCRDVIEELGEGTPLRVIAAAAGVSVETARDVRDRIGRGEDPLPPGVRGAASRQTPPRPRRSVAVDSATVLDSMKKDPALRYSNEGREVLRWLDTHVIGKGGPDIARRVPAHRATQLAAVARASAAAWNELAGELERRVAG
jgi:hypothetical protein